MAKSYNKLSRALLEKDTGTASNGYLLTEIRKLEGSLPEYSRTHTPSETTGYRDELLTGIKNSQWRRNERQAVSLREKIEKHKQNYIREHSRDASRDLVELRRLEMRFGTMTDNELKAELSEYLQATEPEDLQAFSPDRVDLLAVELKNRGESASLNTLRKHMGERHYSEPWRYAKPGPELYRELEVHDTDYGTFRTGDGMIHDIDSVIEN